MDKTPAPQRIDYDYDWLILPMLKIITGFAAYVLAAIFANDQYTVVFGAVIWVILVSWGISDLPKAARGEI